MGIAGRLGLCACVVTAPVQSSKKPSRPDGKHFCGRIIHGTHLPTFPLQFQSGSCLCQAACIRSHCERSAVCQDLSRITLEFQKADHPDAHWTTNLVGTSKAEKAVTRETRANTKTIAEGHRDRGGGVKARRFHQGRLSRLCMRVASGPPF
jgi:hypothetical protein